QTVVPHASEASGQGNLLRAYACLERHAGFFGHSPGEPARDRLHALDALVPRMGRLPDLCRPRPVDRTGPGCGHKGEWSESVAGLAAIQVALLRNQELRTFVCDVPLP